LVNTYSFIPYLVDFVIIQRYQTAINKCVTKQALTVVDLHAFVKQAREKGEKSIKKGRDKLVRHFQERFDCLQGYLPVSTCNDIKAHIAQQDIGKATKVYISTSNKKLAAKSDKIDMFDNLVVANMSVPTNNGDTSTTSMGISEVETLEFFDVNQDTAGSLLELANSTGVFSL
jgi:hypothetical protein